MFLYSVYFMSLKILKKSTALLSTFLWAMGFFCFGVSWLNVSIHQFGGASLGVVISLSVCLRLILRYINALYLFGSAFQSAKCGNFAVIWTLTEFFTGLDFLLVFLGFSLVIHKLTAHFMVIAPIFWA